MIKTGKQLAEAAVNVANNYKTLYVLGCFGAPMTEANKKRYKNNNDFNKSRSWMIDNKDSNTFGFDCVCLIKSLLWGWNGDPSKSYGGAAYGSNGVPDIGADTMLDVCSNISTDFSHIEIGEAVGMPGHIGIYVGNGLAVECTPIWNNKVQITAVGNIGKKAGYNTRNWVRHGKLPYVSYIEESEDEPMTSTERKEFEELKMKLEKLEVKIGMSEAEIRAIVADEFAKQNEKAAPKKYHYFSELPDYAQKPIRAMWDNGYLSGRSAGDLDLTEDMMRLNVQIASVLKDKGMMTY